MVIHFLCLCPLRLAIMLNFKNIESGLDFTCYAKKNSQTTA